jgi:DNA-directed RNA polymerase specialized sigma24 family protein
MDEELRTALLRLVRYKFTSYPNVATLADDIVNDAYVKLRTNKGYETEKENYGYLSVVCMRLAYRKFMALPNGITGIYPSRKLRMQTV